MTLRFCSSLMGAALALVIPAAASAGQQRDQHEHACCDAAVCCRTSPATGGAARGEDVSLARQQSEPIRQTLTVRFQRPVKIGDRILLGQYLIEHDNARMARGRPCTHIYEASDPRLPVVAFHCTHLRRSRGLRPSVTLRPLGEPNGMAELVEFQFAGETGGHGVPVVR